MKRFGMPVALLVFLAVMLLSLGTAPSLKPAAAAAGKTIGFGQAITMTFGGLSAGGTILVRLWGQDPESGRAGA